MDDDDFNLRLGRELKEQGIAASANAKKDLLALGRHYCLEAALRRTNRTATADDAARGFKRAGFDVDVLGNASGALFRGKGWMFTGRWKQSRRTTNHAHQNRVWRLNG